MQRYSKGILGTGSALALTVALAAVLAAPAGAAGERALFVSVGANSRPPIGWVEFCVEMPHECNGAATIPRDAVLSTKAWKDLVRVNRWVNETIKPMTDVEHWGVVLKWFNR